MSNKALSYAFIFSLGAAVGSAVAWRLCKNKYEQIAREEIASVKEVFSERLKKEAETVTPEHEETKTNVEDANTYEEIARDYNTVSNADRSERKEDHVSKPYVISPDEFGEDEEYECISLTYYADNVLTDDVDDVIYDIDGIVGEYSLTQFGAYDGDEDSVYVKNDKTRCYYEILRDSRNYSDVYGR